MTAKITLRNLTTLTDVPIQSDHALAYTIQLSTQQPDPIFQLRVFVSEECSEHMEVWRIKAGRILLHTILPIRNAACTERFIPQFPTLPTA